MNAKPTILRELLSEFLGTFVLILLGTGVVAMVVLFPSRTPGELVHGGYTNITLGWGLAVTMGIYVAGKTSGAHLNPAVTLSLAVFRGFSWRKVVPYSVAQTAGAFTAAALAYWNYLPAFHQADPQLEKTAGVFTTFPAFPGLPQAGFLDQVVGTGLLLLLIFAITDELNLPPGANRLYDVPFVTSNRATQYSITNSPLAHSEVIRIAPLERASWQATRALYVVRLLKNTNETLENLNKVVGRLMGMLDEVEKRMGPVTNAIGRMDRLEQAAFNIERATLGVESAMLALPRALRSRIQSRSKPPEAAS